MSGDPGRAGAMPSAEDAQRAIELMGELSIDLRGCAVIDSTGSALAATGEPREWARAGAALLEAADAAGGDGARSDRVHVGTEDGEVFAVREGDLAMVCVTERFTLASLALFDMRTILRDIAAGDAGRDRRLSDGDRHGEGGERADAAEAGGGDGEAGPAGSESGPAGTED